MTDARFHTVWIPLQERFYRVAYYLLEDRADALDTVQDLYVKLWKMRDTLDLRGHPIPWRTISPESRRPKKDWKRRKPSGP